MLSNYHKNKRLQEILRVNHSGELGAKYIYLGQLKVLKDNKEIQHMLEKELEHLAFFENEIEKRGFDKSILAPLWKAGGFGLGVISSLISKNNAMLLTESIENTIVNHYQSQIAELENYNEDALKQKVQQFQNDEKEHLDTAVMEGSKAAILYNVINNFVTVLSKASIKIAEKV